MIYFDSGVKLKDSDFVQIKAIMQKGQASLDAELEHFQRRTSHERPGHPEDVNDEPRRHLGYNVTRIKKETLQKVLEYVSKAVDQTVDVHNR